MAHRASRITLEVGASVGVSSPDVSVRFRTALLRFACYAAEMEQAMRTLPDLVSDERGTFQARAVARESPDGRWEAWLEFVPADEVTSGVSVTEIETHQRDRVTVERWMSGLTRVYAEGALSRAVTVQHRVPAPSHEMASLIAEPMKGTYEEEGEHSATHGARRMGGRGRGRV